MIVLYCGSCGGELRELEHLDKKSHKLVRVIWQCLMCGDETYAAPDRVMERLAARGQMERLL